MTTPIVQDDHQAAIDELAAIVDGDAAALARHAAHLAACDACRDARHDAARIAGAIAAAGADHAPAAGDALVARLLAAVDAPGAAGASGAPARPEPAPARAEPAARRDARPVTPFRAARTARTLTIGLVAAAALAAGALGVARLRGGAPGATPAGEVVAGTGARVERIRRAAPATAPGGGLEVRAPGAAAFAPAAPGDAIAAGSRIRTDAHTRAWLALDDGTALTLDHATELALDARAPRLVEVAAGRLVADVAARPEPAAFVTPGARVDVLGTRLALTASPDHTAVQVERGAVRLTARGGGSVEVRAGEEGSLAAGGAPEVAAIPSLAADLGWAEAAADPGPDTASAGVGALRAYRPGEARDRDWNLALARHEVSVRVVGPIARTEITETFRNDSDVTLEGVFQFPLPPDARIDRLALDVPGQPGRFEEGAFLDRERAARIWQGVIDRATPRSRPRPPAEMIWVPGPWRDPALLEWERGGRFELRVFPIPPNSERTIQIAYTQVLAPHGASRRYVYPLPHAADGSTVADELSFDVRIAGAAPADVRVSGYGLVADADGGDAVLRARHRAFVPRGDLVIAHRPPGRAELRAWTFAGGVAVAPDPKLAARKDHARLGIDPLVLAAQRDEAADARPAVVLAIRPELPRWQASGARDVVLVVDASQSMVGERRARAIELAAAAIDGLDRRDRVAVLACDARCRALPGGLRAPSPQAVAEARAWLEAEPAAGASDLVAAVRAGLDVAAGARAADRDAWVVYVGDGFATTGFRRSGDVEALVADAAARAGARVATVGIGGDADEILLGAVARGGGGHHVAWRPGQLVAATARALVGATRGAALRDATIELPAGIVDAAPGKLPTIRAGEEILVAGRLAPGGAGEVRGEVVLRGTVAGQPWEQRYPVTLTASTAPGNAFVPRLWAALTIEELERAGRGEDRARIVGLSQAYGVLSRHTSLLVLESEAMFQAFAVDRTRPAVTWTGDAPLDEVASDGTIAHDEGEDRVVTATPAKAKRPAPMGAGRAAIALDEDGGGWGGGGGWVPPIERAPSRRRDDDRVATTTRPARGPGQWMRKVWFRVGAVAAYDGAARAARDAVERAEDALAASPDSRERHRALVQALAYAGELERAQAVAEAWLARDRLDPEALTFLADALGRQGRRDEAARWLAGIVDLAPDDVALHDRLARAHDRAGELERACGHRVALAALRRDDAPAAGAAIRCLRALGRDGDAALIARGLSTDALRVAAEKAAGNPVTPERVGGDLTVDATWTGGADLDLSIIAPDGRRLSWMGGRDGVAAADAGTVGRERLALRRAPKGRYLVEVVRTRPGDATPVRGSIKVTILGVSRTLPFTLDGDRAVIGRVDVTLQSRLEPVTDAAPPRPR